MTPKEKSLNILEKINNGKISKESWKNCSKYAKQDLKRKAYIVVDECLKCCIGSHVKFWKEVKQEIEKL